MSNSKEQLQGLDRYDIVHLAKVFEILIQMDERNKIERRYKKKSDSKTDKLEVIDKNGQKVLL